MCGMMGCLLQAHPDWTPSQIKGYFIDNAKAEMYDTGAHDDFTHLIHSWRKQRNSIFSIAWSETFQHRINIDMTVSTINIGNIANDGTGDDLREAFIKVNNNFLELEARNPEQTTASNQFADTGATAGVFKEKDGFNLKFKNITAGNNISLQTDDNQIIINTAGTVSIQFTADAGTVHTHQMTCLNLQAQVEQLQH